MEKGRENDFAHLPLKFFIDILLTLDYNKSIKPGARILRAINFS
jgi:hypothetical protein